MTERYPGLSTAIVDAANRGRPNEGGVKVGGHQASSASIVDIMVSLWFSELSAADRVSVTLAQVPGDEDLRERRHRHAIAGGYRPTENPPSQDDVTLVGVGAIMPEFLAAAERLVSRTSPPGWSV